MTRAELKYAHISSLIQTSRGFCWSSALVNVIKQVMNDIVHSSCFPDLPFALEHRRVSATYNLYQSIISVSLLEVLAIDLRSSNTISINKILTMPATKLHLSHFISPVLHFKRYKKSTKLKKPAQLANNTTYHPARWSSCSGSQLFVARAPAADRAVRRSESKAWFSWRRRRAFSLNLSFSSMRLRFSK